MSGQLALKRHMSFEDALDDGERLGNYLAEMKIAKRQKKAEEPEAKSAAKASATGTKEKASAEATTSAATTSALTFTSIAEIRRKRLGAWVISEAGRDMFVPLSF